MKDNAIESNFVFKISTIIVILLYFLIIIGSLNASRLSFALLGLIALFIVLLITNVGLVTFLIKGVKLNKIQLAIVFLIGLLLTLCIVSILNNSYRFKDLVNTVQMIACLNTMVYISFIKFKTKEFGMINKLVIFFVLIHFSIFMFMEMPSLFASIYNNSNLIGPFMFYTSFFLIYGVRFSKYKVIYMFVLAISLLLILASETRSIFLSIAAACFVFIFWKYIVRSRIIAIMFFLVIIVISISIIYLYPLLPTFQFYLPLERWVISHTGKSIMSGRNELWQPLIEIINQKPFLGYGPGTLAEELFSRNQSPHNLYLNIMMQIGYIGLLVVLIIFLLVWVQLTRGKDNFVSRLSASYFIGIIVHQSFETTLFQNQLSIGLLQIFIIGVGLSVTIHQEGLECKKLN